MGKKLKKKARSGQRDKRVSSAVAKTDSLNTAPNSTEPTNDKVTVLKDRRFCSHVNKGVDLDKLSAKLRSSRPVKCEDCRENMDDRRAKSRKGKQGKKKGGVDPKSEPRKIWVCLECGHFSCGGVGLPSKPQTHAIRHSKQHHHPLAVQFDNPQLWWCFTCSTLIPAENSGDGVEQTDILPEIAKMIKARLSEGHSVDVEDVWFGSGSVLSVSNSENSIAVGSHATDNYIVRGLVNLGNTCFFNSVLQNLLALDQLRDHYGKLDGSFGSLTAALKKLVGEISPNSGLRNVINPKSFFSNICAKAPQFRGFQQQDSHELLRCLLDGLSTEEASARKRIKSAEEDKDSVEENNAGPTFVDAVFGGQLSSTVTCLECGHTSIVYEPFLDLSLPVPTKKPPSKKAQSVARIKTSKLPPKRSGRTRPKPTRDGNALPPQSSSDKSSSGKSSCLAQADMPTCLAQADIPIPEQKPVAGGDSGLSLSSDTSATACDSSLQDHKANQDNPDVIQTSIPSDDFTWLDFLGDDAVSNIDNDVVSQMDDLNIGSADESAAQNDLVQHPLECCGEKILSCSDNTSHEDIITRVDHHKQETLLDAQAVVGQINGTGYTVLNDITFENVTEPCSQNGSRDLNLAGGSSGNFSKEEPPLRFQDSTALLHPYKEDTHPYKEDTSVALSKTECEVSLSATVGYEQDSVDFEGFGDLFNEPEAAESSSLKPSSGNNACGANELVGVGFVGNSSESEPDDIDNTDTPVSVKSCLAYFTKLELLSKDEHGWQCENCSKLLRNKMQNPASESQNNGVEDIDIYGLKDSTMEGTNEFVLDQKASRRDNKKSEAEIAPFNQVESYYPLSNYNDINECNVDESTLTKGGESEGNENDKTEIVKVERDANKRILISKAPPILTIHLKRFSQDTRGRLSKLNGHVGFDYTIDMKPYMDSRCTDGDRYKYRLVGIVEHSGTMKGGHYVAYIRGGKKSVGMDNNGGEDYVWYHASDAYVGEASLDEVLGSEAYILFYEQI